MRRVRGEHRQHRRDLAAPDNHDRRAILVIEVQPARQRTRVTARRPPPRVLEHHTMLAQIRQAAATGRQRHIRPAFPEPGCAEAAGHPAPMISTFISALRSSSCALG
jgi:hypothetical protein